MTDREKGPRKMGSVVNQLMARKGYGRIQGAGEIEQAWQQCVDPALLAHTRVGNVKRGTLLVMAADSVTVQELTFAKRRILKKLQQQVPHAGITELRFQQGQIN